MFALPLAALLILPAADPPPAGQTAAAEEVVTPPSPEAAKAALQPFNPLVGEWRGVGQVRRGSRVGAWREDAAWLWDFDDPARPAVRLDVTEGKEVSRLLVRPGTAGGFTATLTPPTGDPVSLLAPPPPAPTPAAPSETPSETPPADPLATALAFEPVGDGADRLTLRKLSDKRFTLLIERRNSPTGRFRRVAEVGYTRSGERLAESSLGGPECVVTGGLGTIEVSHDGKTYFVCCSGCVTAFEADPAGVLADYAARKAEERAARDRPEPQRE